MIPSTSNAAALERHYTVAEVAKMWRVSTGTVYTVFAEVEGVLRYNGKRGSASKRKVLMRIPESVVLRVHAALTQGADFTRCRKPTGPALGKKSSVAAAASRSL